MIDPFARLRDAAADREIAQYRWEREVHAVRALGYSLRTIADAAGVSHDTVRRIVS